MKTTLLSLCLVASVLVCVPAYAQFTGPGAAGGYAGPGSENRGNSVAAILKNPVDD
jgi:hypothetical protein